MKNNFTKPNKKVLVNKLYDNQVLVLVLKLLYSVICKLTNEIRNEQTQFIYTTNNKKDYFLCSPIYIYIYINIYITRLCLSLNKYFISVK